MNYYSFSACFLGLLILCLFAFTVHAIHTSPVGVIVMEDEVMLNTDTEDPNDPTLSIQVFSLEEEKVVLTITDCQEQICRTDLSTLSPGDYLITLTTSKQKTYTAQVTVGGSL